MKAMIEIVKDTKGYTRTAEIADSNAAIETVIRKVVHEIHEPTTGNSGSDIRKIFDAAGFEIQWGVGRPDVTLHFDLDMKQITVVKYSEFGDLS